MKKRLNLPHLHEQLKIALSLELTDWLHKRKLPPDKLKVSARDGTPETGPSIEVALPDGDSDVIEKNGLFLFLEETAKGYAKDRRMESFVTLPVNDAKYGILIFIGMRAVSEKNLELVK